MSTLPATIWACTALSFLAGALMGLALPILWRLGSEESDS